MVGEALPVNDCAKVRKSVSEHAQAAGGNRPDYQRAVLCQHGRTKAAAEPGVRASVAVAGSANFSLQNLKIGVLQEHVLRHLRQGQKNVLDKIKLSIGSIGIGSFASRDPAGGQPGAGAPSPIKKKPQQ
eukprot:jgi/Tetstr1/455150/TSEL_042000.t1